MKSVKSANCFRKKRCHSSHKSGDTTAGLVLRTRDHEDVVRPHDFKLFPLKYPSHGKVASLPTSLKIDLQGCPESASKPEGPPLLHAGTGPH